MGGSYALQPNVHFVNSSLPAGHPQQCRLPCCTYTPSPFYAGTAGGDTKKVHGKSGPAKQQRALHHQPETFYINTITNNYYHIKRQQQQQIHRRDAKKQQLEQNGPAVSSLHHEEGEAQGYFAPTPGKHFSSKH